MFTVDSNEIFELPGTNGRWVHLATARKGIREYMCFIDVQTNKCYIEEITGSQLEFIHDDELAFDLAKFFEEKGLSDPRRLMQYMNNQAIAKAQGKK